MGKMKVIGYVRVSTQKQADEGVSLAAQVEKIKKWADLNNGTEPVHIFRDAGVSGAKRAKSRPGLTAALSAVSKGDCLIVYSLSRLSRSLLETLLISEELNRRNIDLVSITDRIDTTTAGGKLFFHIMAAFNQHYRDTISDVTKAALAYKRSRGEYLGGLYAPFGQEIKKGSNKLVPVPKEQRAIRRIHNWQREGLSLMKIAKKLEAQGVRRKAGGRTWDKTSIVRLLARTAENVIIKEDKV